jgi:hypothetical protein
VAVRSEHLARFHQALRIERSLDRPHHLDLDRTRAALQFVTLPPTAAVLGVDVAAEFVPPFINDALERALRGNEGGVLVGRRWRLNASATSTGSN